MKTSLSKVAFVTSAVTAVLLVFCFMVFTQSGGDWPALIFTLSPFMMIWLVITVLRDKKHRSRELKEGEEFGYGDRNKDSLGMF